MSDIALKAIATTEAWRQAARRMVEAEVQLNGFASPAAWSQVEAACLAVTAAFANLGAEQVKAAAEAARAKAAGELQ
jgi:hypothetical protein